METGCSHYAKTYHGNWLYMIGLIELKALNRHRFILVTIDYSTKWVEVASYAHITKQVVSHFIKNNIICRYEIPNKTITDNGSNINNKMMKELYESFKIKHHNSLPYRLKMNDTIEIKVSRKSYKKW